MVTCLFAGLLLYLAPGPASADDIEDDRELRWRLNGAIEGARLLRNGAPFWQLASRRGTIPAGSDVEVPEGGGLVRPDVGGIVIEKLARFQVPSNNDGDSLQHIQGLGRYHIRQRFDVATPQLSLSTAGALFDLNVDVYGTQIDVVQGVISVATYDGVSEKRLKAGQSARVNSTNLAKLEIRQPGQASFITSEFGQGRSASSNDDRQSQIVRANNGAPKANNGPSAGNNQNAASSAANDNQGQSNRGGSGNGGNKGNGGNSGKGGGNGKGGGKGNGGGNGKGKGKN